jgi:hypothetical protein
MPLWLYMRLRDYATTRGMPLATVARAALAEFLDREDPQRGKPSQGD